MRFSDHGRLAFRFCELNQLNGIGDVGLQFFQSLDAGGKTRCARASAFCAASASSQSAGSSTRLFSSSSRATATSQSKMPPEQGDGLGDLFV